MCVCWCAVSPSQGVREIHPLCWAGLYVGCETEKRINIPIRPYARVTDHLTRTACFTPKTAPSVSTDTQL